MEEGQVRPETIDAYKAAWRALRAVVVTMTEEEKQVIRPWVLDGAE